VRVIQTEQTEHIVNEKRVMSVLDSPFCVKLYATYQTDDSVFFLQQCVLGGELFTILRANGKFEEATARFYAACVVLAFEHLHLKDIIYRDLKPENLLLDSNGYLIITDFGFAKKRNTTCTLCGTPAYLAPEVIHNWVQSFAVDWWSLGVLMYEMVEGHPPFEDDEHNKMYEKILVSRPAFTDSTSAELRDLIEKLLEKNAYLRIGSSIQGATQIRAHPFFKDLEWAKLQRKEIQAPYKPKLESNVDVSNFEDFNDEDDDDMEYPQMSNVDDEYLDWTKEF